jgi:hypothetical protein
MTIPLSRPQPVSPSQLCNIRRQNSFSFSIPTVTSSHSELILILRILQTVGRTLSTGDQPCRKPATYTGQHKEKSCRHPRFELDPTTPVFVRAKSFRAQDSPATLIGVGKLSLLKYNVASRPVARQRPRNTQLYNSRC